MNSGRNPIFQYKFLTLTLLNRLKKQHEDLKLRGRCSIKYDGYCMGAIGYRYDHI